MRSNISTKPAGLNAFYPKEMFSNKQPKGLPRTGSRSNEPDFLLGRVFNNSRTVSSVHVVPVDQVKSRITTLTNQRNKDAERKEVLGIFSKTNRDINVKKCMVIFAGVIGCLSILTAAMIATVVLLLLVPHISTLIFLGVAFATAGLLALTVGLAIRSVQKITEKSTQNITENMKRYLKSPEGREILKAGQVVQEADVNGDISYVILNAFGSPRELVSHDKATGLSDKQFSYLNIDDLLP